MDKKKSGGGGNKGGREGMEGDVPNQTHYQNAASSPQNGNKTTGTVAPPTVWGCTLSVSSRDKNFILSPMSMHWLTIGKASLTLSSMATGAMFSPPAVMISSGGKEANRLREQAAKEKLLQQKGNTAHEPNIWRQRVELKAAWTTVNTKYWCVHL